MGVLESAEASKPPEKYQHMPTERRMAVLKSAHAKEIPFEKRIDLATRAFLHTPYVLSPLGEARGQDPDPRFRIDAFDCTTFVETAVALAYASDWSKAADILDQIRYKPQGKRFEDRLHFITADWLPQLQSQGYLEDITADLGKDKTTTIKFKVTPKSWKKRRIAKSLVLPKEHVPLGTHELPIIPIAAFKKK